MKRFLFFVFIFTLTQTALSAGGGGDSHGPVETPDFVLYQFINAGIFFAALFFILRPHVKNLFVNRQKSFYTARDKAQELLRQSQQTHQSIMQKLEKLQQTSDDSIKEAQVKSQKIKEDFIKEAEKICQHIQSETQKTTQLEVTLAKESLRKEMINNSFEAAQKELNENLSGEDKKNLQVEFYDKVQAVKG